ncbi:MAG: NAD(P)-dependent oxidoreductase [Owenweeksia sp.]|nr:NAD(P)-dependent oxidoreductase [Owenweeksia sp.]
MKIGIIKEGKQPPDKRVPLSPWQCRQLKDQHPQLEIKVQPSDIRAFTDDEYRQEGITLQEDLNDCEVLMGVKEVPCDMLIPNKTYLFFSHTFKKQPYNRDLLRCILQNKIRLIDYELLKEPQGSRLLGFGRYAGIVGAYNAFRAWGELTGDYTLIPAHKCRDRSEMEGELVKVILPEHTRIVITGAGRVAGGAMEVLSALRIKQVFASEYINEEFNEPVYCQLDVREYFKRSDGRDFSRQDFYDDPTGYFSDFGKYARLSDIYIPCHYWNERSPYIFSREDARDPQFRIKLVSDISCDIDGPVASTLRPSTIEEPFYAYDPFKEKEVALGSLQSIGVSAVDNLPCELPRNASEDFGNELIKNVIPHFFNGDAEGILQGASETTLAGELSPPYQYLKDYVDGIDG